MNKIICLVFVGGGLGNQMFQYACARNKALIENKKLVMLGSMFRKDPDGRTYRLFNLNIPQYIPLVQGKTESFYWFVFRLRKKILELFGVDFENTPIGYKYGLFIVNPAYAFYPLVESPKSISFLWGLFQSEKYFKENINIIKEELRVLTSTTKNKRIIESIDGCNSVCIHIRLGDYKNKRYNKYLNVCNEEYYLKAITYIKAHVKNPVFFVFSNSSEDLSWIKENYNLPDNVIYVDEHNDDYEELELMYHCKHFIISNSSFSWWAQELSYNDEPIVVAPNVWIREYSEPIDIYKDNWKVITV